MKYFCLWYLAISALLGGVSFAQIAQKPLLEKVPFVISNSDLNLSLSMGKTERGNHSSSLTRAAGSPDEELMILKAEALYPDPARAEGSVRTGRRYDPNNVDKTQFYGGYTPPVEETPYWSSGYFDGVKIAEVISGRSIKYYQDLSAAFQRKVRTTSIPMISTSFGDKASVQKLKDFEINGDHYADCFVVTMNLAWNQYCGSLCAMGFDLTKVVVFDTQMKPLALYTERNSNVWVS